MSFPARKFRPSPSVSSSGTTCGRWEAPKRTTVSNREPLPLLDVLTHGVQVRGELHAGGEEALVLLALALAVELLPPLRHEPEGWARRPPAPRSSCRSGTARTGRRHTARRGCLPVRLRRQTSIIVCRAAPSAGVMSTPATAMGSRPTAVRTLYRPPTSSGTTKVS